MFNLHLLNGSLDYAAAVTDCGSRLKPSGHFNTGTQLKLLIKLFKFKFTRVASLTPDIIIKV